jgi:hypothetical protein
VGEVGIGVGAAVFVGVGFGVGVAVAVGVGVGLDVGVAATMSGDGTPTGELATSALATALSEAELVGPAVKALEVVSGEPAADVESADERWLLVQAATAATQRIATTQLAGVGLVVRSRLAIDARLTRP